MKYFTQASNKIYTKKLIFKANVLTTLEIKLGKIYMLFAIYELINLSQWIRRGILIILLIRRGQGMYNLCVVAQVVPRYYCSPGSIVLCVLYNIDVKHEKVLFHW